MLAGRMAPEGFEPLIDRKDIAPGEPWRDRLGQLLRQADAVIILASRNWLASEICLWELSEAEALGKRIVPVAIEPGLEKDLPVAISQLNLVFLDKLEGLSSGLGDIAEALGANLGWIREHTRIGEIADRWQRNGQRRSSLLRGSDLDSAEKWMTTRPDGAPPLTDEQRAFLAASRRAATRRLQGYVGAAAIVAAFSAGSAIFAYRQQIIANERRLQAEANLRGATQAVGTVLFDTIERLRGDAALPIVTQYRLIESARSGIQQLLNVQPENAELQRLQAVTMSVQSDTLRQQGTPREALEKLNEALAIFERILQPVDPQFVQLRDVAVTLGKRAGTYLELGNNREALADASRSVTIGRQLVTQAPQNAAAALNLASGLRQLALARSRLNPEEDVIPLLDEQIALVRPLVERAGAPYQAAVSLIEGLYQRSTSEIARKNFIGARATLEEAYRYTSAQAQANRNALWPSETTTSLLVRMSEVELAEGRTDAARTLLFRALQEINRVIERDLSNAGYMFRLVAIADRLTEGRFALPAEELNRIARNVVVRMQPFAAQGRLGPADIERLKRYRDIAER